MHRCFCCGPQTVRLALCLTACAALFAAAGCGGKPYSCVHVSGKITYEDGSLIPADQIHLIFLSQAFLRRHGCGTEPELSAHLPPP